MSRSSASAARCTGGRARSPCWHRGVMTRGAQDLAVTVIPDSGTDELTGISGHDDDRHQGRQALLRARLHDHDPVTLSPPTSRSRNAHPHYFRRRRRAYGALQTVGGTRHRSACTAGIVRIVNVTPRSAPRPSSSDRPSDRPARGSCRRRPSVGPAPSRRLTAASSSRSTAAWAPASSGRTGSPAA